MKNLPSNIEAEKQLLGSILLDNENIGNVIELLKPECFYYAPNRIIYKAILDLYNENIVADTVSVFEKLKGTVNPADIAKCTQDISSAANAGYLARVVYEKYMRRELIKTAEEIIKGNEDESKDVFELLSEAQNKISVVTENISQSEKNLFDRLDEIIGSLKSRLVSDDDSLQSEYFPTLNKITNGFRKGNMISLSGKDKTGKSTFAYKLTLDFAVNSKIPVGIFSFEMSQEVLDWKALSLETGINYNKLRNPKGWNEATRLSESEIDNLALQAGRKFYRTKIYTCDKVLNELQIKAKMKKWIKEYGVEFFVIDYIGLIPTAKKIETREREVSYLSRFFKTTTAELNTRTLILSQQNRAGELAESLGLERDPDFALTIQKPFEEGVRQIKLNSGDEQQIFDLTENDFLVTLKRSRHGKQGNQFLVGYPENSNDFVEKSLHGCNTF